MNLAAPYRRTGKLEGRCLCGAVSISVDGDHVAAVSACHCLMCQRSNGVLCAGFDAAPDAVTVDGPVKLYQSSSFAERAFCSTCGTSLYLRNLSDDAEYELSPGLFEGARDFPLISEIYTDRAPAYVPLAGDHARQTRADYEADNLHIEGDAP